MDILRFALEAPRLSQTNKKCPRLDTSHSLHAEANIPLQGGDDPRLSSVAPSYPDFARTARPHGRTLCLVDAFPAVASEQPSQPLPAGSRPNSGQMVTSDRWGTPARRRNVDRDGLESVTLQRSDHPILFDFPAGGTIQQSPELHTISCSKSSTIPVSQEGHVTQREVTSSSSPILQSDSIRKSHLAATPQTSGQVPTTRWLPETGRDAPSGPSGPREPRESGDSFRSANAQVDSHHERSMHRSHAEHDDLTTSMKLSGGPPAPPLSKRGISWPSSLSPLGPSLTKTASYSMHTTLDMPSFEPRPERKGGHSRAPPSPHESRKVTNDKRSYSRPAVIRERLTFQPYPVERNNSCIATNEDLDYDPRETMDKVSPVRSTAGADETEMDEDPLYDTAEVHRHQAESGPRSIYPPPPILDHGTSQPNVATRADPYNIQGIDPDSTCAYDISESQASSKHHLAKPFVDMRQSPILQVDSSREEHTHRYRAQQVDHTESLQSFTAVTPYNWMRDVPSSAPEVGFVMPYNSQSHANSSATNKAPVPEEGPVVTVPASSKLQQLSRPPQGVSMDSDISHSRSLARPYTVSSITSDISGPNPSAITEQSALRSTDSDYLDSYAPSVSEINESREMYPLPPDFRTLLSGVEPRLSLTPKADGTVKTHPNNDLRVCNANVESHLYTPEFTGMQQISAGSDYGFSDGRRWTEGNSNTHLRSPGSTHVVVPPQGHENHIDERPSSLYGPQQYSVPHGISSSMGSKREQLARPGLPPKPSPVVLPYLPPPQSPPIVSEQPRFYPPPRTGRSPSRGTEQDTGQLRGKYPPGGMNINIFCCSKSSTQASRH